MHSTRDTIGCLRINDLLRNGIRRRRISASLVAWVNNVNYTEKIYGYNEEELKEGAKKFLEKVTPINENSEGSLWRKGEIIAEIKFSHDVKE